MEINSKEAIDRMAKRLHAEADALRVIDRRILQDCKSGMSFEDIKKKNGCSIGYVKLFIYNYTKSSVED